MTTTTRAWDRPFFKAAENKPEVIAHRGGARQWPGETIFAFEQALAIGVDVIEMDVRSTADDKLVLIHNDTVDETTNVTGPVRKFSLEDLQNLDAGYRWTADGKTFPFRGQGIKVPTLEEVLERFPGQRMNIEIKQKEPSIVEACAEMLRKHKMRDKVLVASMSDGVLEHFRRVAPEVATSAGGTELIKFILGSRLMPSSVKAPDTDSIQVKSKFSFLPIMTARVVRAAHRLGMPIHAWTVNDLADMRRVISLGVDGIITDFPGPLLELLGR
ncbi:MAG TPA: glycerophosphodiester phosphodiesterase [Pyrinomonadaceae bacterium]|nr:glycerophosphodiester phosphodiesterase [Pyrinomonadaceae bacterium]